GPARSRGDEDGCLASLTQLSDCGHEVSDAAMQLDGRLAGDMMRARVEAQLGDNGSLGKPGGDLVPIREERVWRRRFLVTVLRLLVAVLQLVQKLRNVG